MTLAEAGMTSHRQGVHLAGVSDAFGDPLYAPFGKQNNDGFMVSGDE